MPKIELKQNVDQFADENVVCEQIVYLDTEDEAEPWMVISHDGNEISLSVSNWKSLVKLSNEVLEQAASYIN